MEIIGAIFTCIINIIYAILLAFYIVLKVMVCSFLFVPLYSMAMVVLGYSKLRAKCQLN